MKTEKQITAPWEQEDATGTYGTSEYRMVSLRISKKLAIRLANMAGYLGTNKSTFMRHAIITLLIKEETKLQHD